MKTKTFDWMFFHIFEKTCQAKAVYGFTSEEKLGDKYLSVKVGFGFDEKPDMGPLVTLRDRERILKMVNTNEYKRYQTPPILRVSPKAFGKGRRLPIVGKYLS